MGVLGYGDSETRYMCECVSRVPNWALRQSLPVGISIAHMLTSTPETKSRVFVCPWDVCVPQFIDTPPLAKG